MGLDMYAFAVPSKDGLGDVDQPMDEYATTGEIYYWRKFNHLHGWMEKLYRTKGGDKEFNCTSVRLLPSDLDRLWWDTCENKLVYTPGSFFGGPDMDEGDADSVLEFIRKAKAEINSGKAVYYYSWW